MSDPLKTSEVDRLLDLELSDPNDDGNLSDDDKIDGNYYFSSVSENVDDTDEDPDCNPDEESTSRGPFRLFQTGSNRLQSNFNEVSEQPRPNLSPRPMSPEMNVSEAEAVPTGHISDTVDDPDYIFEEIPVSRGRPRGSRGRGRGRPSRWRGRGVGRPRGSRGRPRGENVGNDELPTSIFFTGVFVSLLVKETNRFAKDYLERNLHNLTLGNKFRNGKTLL
jgi:hypothetical protein